MISNLKLPHFIPRDKHDRYMLESTILSNCLNGAYWCVADILVVNNFTTWSESHDYKAIWKAIKKSKTGVYLIVLEELREFTAVNYRNLILDLSTNSFAMGSTSAFALKLIEIQVSDLFIAHLNIIASNHSISNTIKGAVLDLLKDTENGTEDILILIDKAPFYLSSLGLDSVLLSHLHALKEQFLIKIKSIRRRTFTHELLNNCSAMIHETDYLNFLDSRIAKGCMAIILGLFEKSAKRSWIIPNSDSHYRAIESLKILIDDMNNAASCLADTTV